MVSEEEKIDDRCNRCNGRWRYLITLGQTGGVFNNASVKKIYEGGKDAKIQIGENGKSIIFECDIYSNPIFISVFK